ncbi:MAG TPA: hypothetical protein VKT72_04070 [Candidatus Baltobacteraceae bacterium]|nr:hypothetical protein [Candidatus Baltobacteraceae bacterium]
MPFLVAVALVAAALGDPLVEAISNSGVVGRGFSDDNHLSVIPTLIAGISLALLLICRRCVEMFRRPGERRDWLTDMARHVTVRSPLHDVPYVLVLQLAALFVMESVEQLFFGGRLLGGTVWLGGPIWFSLLMHVSLGCACTFLIARGMRAILRRCATLVGVALEFFLDAVARENASVFARRRRQMPCHLSQNAHAHQFGERAPPLLLAPI